MRSARVRRTCLLSPFLTRVASLLTPTPPPRPPPYLGRLSSAIVSSPYLPEELWIAILKQPVLTFWALRRLRRVCRDSQRLLASHAFHARPFLERPSPEAIKAIKSAKDIRLHPFLNMIVPPESFESDLVVRAPRRQPGRRSPCWPWAALSRRWQRLRSSPTSRSSSTRARGTSQSTKSPQRL